MIGLKRAASLATAFALFVFGLAIAPPALSANTCAAPGRDGPSYLAPTYFPGTTLVASAGTSTVAVGAARADANASATAVLPGDLILIIQMQDGTYSNSNSSAYGDGSTGRGATSLGNAGRYEFKTVAAVGIGTITFTQPLAYTYTTSAATLTTGQRRYQVIRVPQFSALTIGGTVTAPNWDGATGGVYAIDVTGTLTLTGSIDLTGKGFRGGAAILNGVLNGITDYTGLQPLTPTLTPALGATKGEGIAGTPRFVAQQSTLIVGAIDLLTSGYASAYDVGRGAPGNAGGGGDQHNAGGGGGGNAGSGFSTDGGGKGGFTYATYSASPIALQTCTPLTSGATTYYACNGDNSRDVGGLGGAAVSASVGRLFMGGGGGAGDVNNTENATVPQNNGGTGGGIVFVRAGSLAGGGSLKADGNPGLDSGKDGAGGGGAGGTIVVHSNAGSYAVAASARGGNGGRSGYVLQDGGELQGPGGGGGGGLVITSSGVSVGAQSVAGGSAGTNSPLSTLSNAYGATGGAGGVSGLAAAIADPLGSACLPALAVVKTAPGAAISNGPAGTTVPYTVTITNNGNGPAQSVDLLDNLPTNFTYTGGATVTLAGGATGSSPPTNSGTTTAPILGVYTVPVGGSVALAFSATVAAGVSGTFPNVGTGRYLDPTRTVANAKASVNSAAANVTINPAPLLAGNLYLDPNHNATFDAGETGPGIAGLYVKLAASVGGVCQAPALLAAPVDATTGAYSLGAVSAGGYCLIVSNNNTLSTTTPYLLPAVVGTEAPTGVRAVTVSTAVLGAQNFGYYSGSSVVGRVFIDNGAGGGTANDGVANGTESGVAGATVNVLSGASTVATATTDAGGAYTAWIPSSVSGALSIAEPLPAGTLATGGSAGTTGGTYGRAANATTFTFASGQAYVGVNYGNVPVNTFTPDNAQTAGAGATVPYAHSFVAGSAGQLTFTTTAASTPAAAWTQAILLDANCNGVVDGGETAVSGAIAVTAGQTVCIVVRDTGPAAAANGAQDVVTVSASLAYANASPALNVALTRTDTTTVSSSVLLQLAKQVRNVTKGTSFAASNTALPNEVLEYQVTATNPASGAVSSVVVNDSTPAYTTFVAASCPGTLPVGISACAVTAQPAVGGTGATQWTFTGTLAAGASVGLTYQVRVAP